MSGRRRDTGNARNRELVHLPEIARERFSVASAASHNRFHDLYYKYEWPNLSDAGTGSPECVEEIESGDSSASSMFSWADPNGTQLVGEEWEKIQRTLYEEDGPKVTQKRLIDECEQWKATFPHLRLVGKKYSSFGPETEDAYVSEEEILAANEYCRDADSEISQVWKSNFCHNGNFHKPFISKPYSGMSKRNARDRSRDSNLVYEMDSYLHISNLDKTYRIGTSSSLMRSELSSSKWRHKNLESPDYNSLPRRPKIFNQTQKNSSRQNSATSTYSNTVYRSNNLERGKVDKKSIYDKRSSILEPIEPMLISRIMPTDSSKIYTSVPKSSTSSKRVSLPPLKCDENKSVKSQLLDNNFPSTKKYKRNKSLTPLDSTTISNINGKGNYKDEENYTKRKPNKKKKSKQYLKK